MKEYPTTNSRPLSSSSLPKGLEVLLLQRIKKWFFLVFYFAVKQQKWTRIMAPIKFPDIIVEGAWHLMVTRQVRVPVDNSVWWHVSHFISLLASLSKPDPYFLSNPLSKITTGNSGSPGGSRVTKITQAVSNQNIACYWKPHRSVSKK